MNESTNGDAELQLLASYAFKERKHLSNRFKAGEGLVGQCALEKERILLNDVPANYVQINSGLGEASPSNIVVLPVLFEDQVKAVIELASFQRFSDIHLNFLDQLTESIGIVLNTITATMRTEELLKQSQTLATELQTRQEELTETNQRLQEQARSLQSSEERLRQQQEELQQTNEELEEKAELLSKQNMEVERKNREIQSAKLSLEEKAQQLAITSKYKSEFLANMLVPLLSLGEVKAVVTLVGNALRRFGPTDLHLAEDIARRAALAMDNASLYREAHDANRAKDEFLATVSHELRTPLNAILGWTRLLREESLDKETVTRALETIERNGRSQAQLIEDILDASRIITGKLRLISEPVELVSVIRAALDAVRPTANTKGIHLEESLDYPYRIMPGHGF